MIKLSGTVHDIETDKNGLNSKKVVELHISHNERCQVFFYTKNITLLDKVKPGDEISIKAKIELGVSKSSGVKYNNIIASECEIIKR